MSETLGLLESIRQAAMLRLTGATPDAVDLESRWVISDFLARSRVWRRKTEIPLISGVSEYPIGNTDAESTVLLHGASYGERPLLLADSLASDGEAEVPTSVMLVNDRKLKIYPTPTKGDFLVSNPFGLGAVVGNPGTLPTSWSFNDPSSQLSFQVVGVGEDSGFNYVDIRFFGVMTAELFPGVFFGGVQIIFDAPFNILASGVGSVNVSLRIKRVAGAQLGSVLLGVRTYDSAGAEFSFPMESVYPQFLMGQFTKIEREVTIPSSAAFVVPAFQTTFAQANPQVDITIRFALPELYPSGSERPAVVIEAVKTLLPMSESAIPAVVRPYHDTVLHGVLARMYKIPDKPYTNIRLAPEHQWYYDRGVYDIRRVVDGGRGRNAMFVQFAPFA